LMAEHNGPTDQGKFWQGEFGAAYTRRNAPTDAALAARKFLWETLLARLDPAPTSILEVGANLGLNLRAIRGLTDAKLLAVEPNAAARQELISSGAVAAENAFDAFGDAIPVGDGAVDLAYTCGVLIHVAPERLGETCDEIHRVSSRFVGCIEYFSADAQEVEYRGHREKLFKRDFGQFWMDRHPDLELVDYGFFWKRVT